MTLDEVRRLAQAAIAAIDDAIAYSIGRVEQDRVERWEGARSGLYEMVKAIDAIEYTDDDEMADWNREDYPEDDEPEIDDDPDHHSLPDDALPRFTPEEEQS